MHVQLPSAVFEQWRSNARRALTRGVSPDNFDLHLSDLAPADPSQAVESPMVPGPFIKFARTVGLHKDEQKWNILYSILWRLHHGEPDILQKLDDPQVSRARFMEGAVQRDMMKMRLFTKFRSTHNLLVAWYAPEHFITEAMAAHFVQSHAHEEWALHTPQLSVHYVGRVLEFSSGMAQAPRMFTDAGEDIWLRYASTQLNPARQCIRMAASAGAGPREGNLAVKQKPRDPKPKDHAHPPETLQLSRLRNASKSCLVCPFAVKSTQTVFGEGPKRATIMMVGEQPGDQEDRAGQPFVGPAGTLLNEILQELGIPRDEVYVTNAVKHFKFESRGKRRLHMKPNGSEIAACRPWLEKEIAAVQPEVILALGATAAQSLCGRMVKVTKERGQWLEGKDTGDSKVMASWHPSAILRSIDEESRKQKMAQLKSDLSKAWKSIRRKGPLKSVESRPSL